MIQAILIEFSFVFFVYLMFDIRGFAGFLAASFIGILLLETVNYIEHYGLLRKANAEGRYERVMPKHSWNSNHVYGRLLLFELSRPSDHHYKASTPYQLLDHIDEAPQMPTGYPGMMLLALVPPLFFSVMNRRVDKLQQA
jgi:alkane 1-monooxygenase